MTDTSDLLFLNSGGALVWEHIVHICDFFGEQYFF